MDLNNTLYGTGNQTINNMENKTLDENKTEDYKYEYYYDGFLPGAKESFYIALVLQWLNTVLIVSLNTAVIVTILRQKKKSRLYFLLMNMAIADLITGLIDAFVNAIERTMGVDYLNYWWFGGDFFCRLQRTLSSVSMCASNFILAAISMDRAVVIAKPMTNLKRGYALQKILILSCWLLGMAVSCPIFKITLEVKQPFPIDVDGPQELPLCFTSLDMDGWKALFYLSVTFYFLIPLIVITAGYTILIWAIYKRARTPPNCVRGIENLKLSVVFNKGLSKTKKRSIKLMFGIVLSFIGAWTPYMVILYMNIFHDYYDPIVMPFYTTFYWNCTVNPIIFFVFYRQKVRESLRQASIVTLTSSVRTSISYTRNAPDRIFHDAEEKSTDPEAEKIKTKM